MPLMDGLSMAQEIYKHNKNQKILITSAYDDKKYLLKLIQMGVDGFLQKPLTSNDIKSVLFDICSKIYQEKKNHALISLPENYQWNKKTKKLFHNTNIVKLSESEKELLTLLLERQGENFTSLEIFDALYYKSEKKFSQDIIKSLVKRLRKKLPKDTIVSMPHLGYRIDNSH